MSAIDDAAIEGFRKICQSLKLYRRAELIDDVTGDPLIDALYVDPLPSNKVLSTLLEPHTTLLIGRKGTGKSTLFQKVQRELLRKGHATSAYLDIKTIFESSQVDPALGQRLEDNSTALPHATFERFLLQKAFLESLIAEIRTQLKRRISAASLWSKVKEAFGGKISVLDEELSDLVSAINIPSYENAVGILQRKLNEVREDKKDTAVDVKLGSSGDGLPSVRLGGSMASSLRSADTRDYSDVLIRTLRLKDFISKLRDLLDKAQIRQLYILVDDFSELPKESMQLVVDAILAPLNNWSEELVKLKIAAYPGRIYYGQIDKAKIDEVYLDLYKLYAPSDVATMEDSAIDFTKRLIGKRFDKFLPGRIDDVFNLDDESLWRELFYASLANPRILGYILHFASDFSLIKGGKIGVGTIKAAARKYYEDKIEPYFGLGKFLHDTFSERLSIFSLKELLEVVVQRARELRSHDSDVFRKIKGTPPTSHFHVPVSMEAVFQTLELNFFLTKYFEMSDRSGKKVSIFCLNYGLCERYSIKFGRPTGEREFRLYFIERVFDDSSIVLSFINKNQDIACEECGQRYSFEQLDSIKLYGMMCPSCKVGSVKVSNLSLKYAEQVRDVSPEILLERIDLNMLAALSTEDTPMKPKDIALELDCSHQLVGRRAKGLEERDLLKRDFDGAQRIYEITDVAKAAYFSGANEGLDIPD